MAHLTVRTADGLDLAVTDHAGEGPTLLLVHGYPDEQSVWDGVVAELADRYRVVTYDVRGAGRSQAPATRQGYRMDRLVADLFAVADAVSPDEAVHVVAHDWGSIQSWAAVTSPLATGRVASFTSVSGPGLDQVGAWMRGRLKTVRGVPQALEQLGRSWYIWMFHVPGLAELFWRRAGTRADVQQRLFDGVSPTRARDGRNGVQLYRANIFQRLAAPAPQRPQSPVQVVVPDGDPFISRHVHDVLPSLVDELYVRDVHAGHWVVRTDPALVAQLVTELVEHTRGETSPALAATRRTR